MKSRHRFCNSPVPAHGGQTCTGNRIQTAACNNNECPGKITRYPSYRVECDDLDLDPWFLEEYSLALCFPLTPFLFPRILSYRFKPPVQRSCMRVWFHCGWKTLKHSFLRLPALRDNERRCVVDWKLYYYCSFFRGSFLSTPFFAWKGNWHTVSRRSIYY